MLRDLIIRKSINSVLSFQVISAQLILREATLEQLLCLLVVVFEIPSVLAVDYEHDYY